MKLVCRQFRTFDEYGHKQTFVFENVNIYVSSVVNCTCNVAIYVGNCVLKDLDMMCANILGGALHCQVERHVLGKNFKK